MDALSIIFSCPLMKLRDSEGLFYFVIPSSSGEGGGGDEGYHT